MASGMSTVGIHSDAGVLRRRGGCLQDCRRGDYSPIGWAETSALASTAGSVVVATGQEDGRQQGSHCAARHHRGHRNRGSFAAKGHQRGHQDAAAEHARPEHRRRRAGRRAPA